MLLTQIDTDGCTGFLDLTREVRAEKTTGTSFNLWSSTHDIICRTFYNVSKGSKHCQSCNCCFLFSALIYLVCEHSLELCQGGRGFFWHMKSSSCSGN